MEKGAHPLQCAKCFTINAQDSPYCSKCGSSLGEPFETLTCGEAADSSPGSSARLKPGQMFDRRYRIVEEIGRGGMGRVYKAEDTELNITVALKIIQPRLSSDPRFIERFKKEMLLARSISHGNVIRIHDLGEAAGVKYISMEYIKGENLREFLNSSGTLAIETVIHLARQVGEALEVAHAKGIVHQDIKPSNIMVDQSGRAYVMDFGLATAAFGAEAQGAGEGAGTPQYMSPEQAKGERTVPASDIYSFGAVLYEMATGRPVFSAETRAEYRRKHVAEIPVSPSRLNPYLPKRLERIILKCLSKSATDRYPTIGDVLGDLSRVPVAGPPSLLDWIKRRWAWASAGTLLAMAAVVGYFLLRPPAPPERRPTLAVMYLANNTGDPSLDFMRRNLCELLIADLLQSQYVRVLTFDRIFGALRSLNLLDAPAYSSEELKKIAAKVRVDYLLQGSFTRAQGQFRVNTTLHKADTLEVLRAEREQWAGEEGQFAMVESLSRKIKVGLNVPAAALSRDIHKDIRKVATGSPEAFKLYIEAKRLFEEQKFEQSLRAAEGAVSLDAGFAMAYRLMAESWAYLQDSEKSEEYIRKALSLLDRVSDREFYLIRGFASSTLREAADMYEKLLTLYPDDLDALGELGATYRNMEEWALAARRFEKALSIDDTDELTFENLAVIYMAQGDLPKAIELLESRRGAFADWFSYHNRLATAYLCDGRSEAALEEARRARALEPADFEPPELEGLIHLVRGDAPAAEATFRSMAETGNPVFQTVGRSWMGHLYLTQGRYARARELVVEGLDSARTAPGSSDLRASEAFLMHTVATHLGLQTGELNRALQAIDEALRLARTLNRSDYIILGLHMRGLVLARQKRLEEARAAAGELRDYIESMGTAVRELRYYHRLAGEIAREEGDLAGAIASFEAARKLLPGQYYKTDVHVLFLDSLASAYYQAGDWDSARAHYEEIGSLTTGRMRWGDLYARSFYWLGRIHETQGRTEQAAGSYRRFLEIWDQADPSIPEVEAARKRLASLGPRPSL